jgi:hypothetical protein
MMNEPRLKKIPYGIANYNQFREENLYFVDKTRFIRNIEDKGSYLFFIRPRRFGKSLLLSILHIYYDIAWKEQFDFLFKGTDIYENPTTEKNTYLVLKFDFSAVDPEISRVEKSFLYYVKDAADFFLSRYRAYLDIDIDLNKAKEELNSRQSPSSLMNTFLKYCKGKGRKIFVIIDEYDNFANTILSTAGEGEYQRLTHGEGFFRSFFNVLKSGTSGPDAPISRLFMTGVSPITLDDVTSGFNIGSNISMDSDLNEILGFTHNEVESMVEYYRQTGKIRHSTPELLEMMCRWYNHYRFSLHSGSKVFNTVHVLYFLKEYMIDSRFPGTLIDHNAMIDYTKLRHLIISDKKGSPQSNGNFSKLRQIMENDSIHSSIVKTFPVVKLVKPENFISLLYHFGLLTIAGVDEENKAVLKIPNESIKRLYYDYFKETYEETGILTLDLSQYEASMKEMAFKGKWKPLIDYLVKQLETSMGIRDLITGEKAIQAFLNVYLGLSDLYLVHSEKELEKGYADLVLVPFLAQYPQLKYSYLMEIKYIKAQGKNKESTPGNIESIKKKAVSQLDRYCLDEKFQKAIGKTTLVKVILVFSGHRLVYRGEVD